MPRCAHAQARYTVVCLCVFVCVCVCVDCYSCSSINEVQVRVSMLLVSFLDFYSWICKIMLCSRVMPVLLTWNVIAPFSEECVAKLVHGVLQVVSSALER